MQQSVEGVQPGGAARAPPAVGDVPDGAAQGAIVGGAGVGGPDLREGVRAGIRNLVQIVKIKRQPDHVAIKPRQQEEGRKYEV